MKQNECESEDGRAWQISIVPDSEDPRFAEGGSEAVFSIVAWDSVRLEIQQLSCSSGSDWKILVPRCQAIEPQKEAGQWEHTQW